MKEDHPTEGEMKRCSDVINQVAWLCSPCQERTELAVQQGVKARKGTADPRHREVLEAYKFTSAQNKSK